MRFWWILTSDVHQNNCEFAVKQNLWGIHYTVNSYWYENKQKFYKIKIL